MACDASTLLASAVANGYGGLSKRQLLECMAYQAGQHSAGSPPAAPVAQAATNLATTSFSANWNASATATGYRLDVSTDPAFGSFVPGFNNLDVSNVLTYSVTGLSGATDYYYQVRAYNAAGTSASSSPAIDAFTSPHPTVVDWSARVVTNGGAAPSHATQSALSTFCYGLDTDNLTSLMKAVCCFVQDSLIACLTPLIKNFGSDPWVNHGLFVAGDVSVNGLQGSTSGSKYLDTGVVPNTAFASNGSLGYTLYNFSGGSSNATDMGIWAPSGSNDALYLNYQGSFYFDCHDSSNGRATTGVLGFVAGYVSANRTTTASESIYKANSSVAHVVAVNSGATTATARSTANIFVFAANSGSSPGNPATANPTISNKLLSFAAIHEGLTSGNSLAFYNRIQALRTALGGGFV